MAKHEHDFRDGLDVCVGNYGYYNEGELHDTWMRLPMDPDKIEPWLRSHGLFDEEHHLDELMNLVAQADDLPVYDYEYDEMHVEDQWHETCLERSTPEENYAYTVLDGDSEFWALMNRGNGELLYCFDFNRYGEIAVNNGYVDLCETCYVDKRADWPALDEYSFEEIRDETVAEWRAHIAEGVVEKPVTPTDLARSASAAAATSAVIAASANQTAPKL